jgi:uncharacterized protein
VAYLACDSRSSNRIAARQAIRLVVCGVWLIVAVVISAVALRSFRGERHNFVALPPDDLVNHPDSLGIHGLRNVHFPSADGPALGGWFVTPRNGASVILLHGTSADRSSLAWETEVLGGAGFGVLAIDWPGYGGSGGTVDWGSGARQALGAAIDWVVAQPGVDGTRIGALGFSNGGYVLAQVAARDRRLGAVAFAATPTDMVEQTRWEYRRYGLISQAPALAALWSGMPLFDDPPKRVVRTISPRPVLVIGSDQDPTVPEYMVRDLYQAAGQPKQLWIARATQHGRYDTVGPEEYRDRLVGFFSSTLNGARVSSAASHP